MTRPAKTICLRIFLLAITTVVAMQISAQAQSVDADMIAIVDLQRAIEGTSDFEEAAQEWTLAMTAQTGNLSAKQEELRQAEERLANGEENLTDRARTELGRTIDRLQREFDRMNMDVQNDLNSLREQLILPITVKVDQAVRTFAEENDLLLVLDVSNPQVGLVLTNRTVDITDTIIRQIEKSPASEDVP